MRTIYITIVIGLLGMLFTSCVQEEHQKEITITLDMSGIEIKGEVGIRGQFLESNWQKTIPMKDANGDGIYEITLSDKTAKNSVEFKFVNGSDYELKGAENRVINFEYLPETIAYHAIFNNPNTKQITK